MLSADNPGEVDCPTTIYDQSAGVGCIDPRRVHFYLLLHHVFFSKGEDVKTSHSTNQLSGQKQRKEVKVQRQHLPLNKNEQNEL